VKTGDRIGKTGDPIHIYLFFRVFPQKMARKMGFIEKTTTDDLFNLFRVGPRHLNDNKENDNKENSLFISS